MYDSLQQTHVGMTLTLTLTLTLDGLINGGGRGGLYPRGLITGIKKNRFETRCSSVDRNTAFIYWFLIKR